MNAREFLAMCPHSHEDLVEAVITYLIVRGCDAWRVDTGRHAHKGPDGKWRKGTSYGTTGAADVTGILPNGRRLDVEVKVKGDSLRPDQKKFRTRVRLFGGLWMLCHDTVDSVEAALTAALEDTP